METFFRLLETLFFFMWLIIGMVFLVVIVLAGMFMFGYVAGLGIDFLTYLFTGHHIDSLGNLSFPVLAGIVFVIVALIKEF